MNRSPRYIHIINTVKVNGSYQEEQRSHRERRKNLKVHFNRYERRFRKHRRHPFKIDIQV